MSFIDVRATSPGKIHFPAYRTTTAFPPLSSIFPKGSYRTSSRPLCGMTFLLFFRTYLVSSPTIAYYYTQLIGDAKNLPTLLAAANFTGIAVVGMYHTKLKHFLD